jgi:hypothetical protein
MSVGEKSPVGISRTVRNLIQGRRSDREHRRTGESPGPIKTLKGTFAPSAESVACETATPLRNAPIAAKTKLRSG